MSVDERRTNVYKMFRATRTGPDTTVDASKQVAFYDPGLGSAPGNTETIAGIGRSIANVVAQATGLGIDKNIIDCYVAIIRLYRPGDRIFLIGFSRGAYTVRCLSGVLSLCGIPRRLPGKDHLLYDEGTVRGIAIEAVKGVYSYTSSADPDAATPRQRELVRQRNLLAAHFRRKYGCGPAGARAHPYFIGVFDTVASVAGMPAMLMTAAGTIVLLNLLAFGAKLAGASFLAALAGLTISSTLLAVFLLYLPRIRWLHGLNGVAWWRSVHVTEARRRFNDVSLNPGVHYARHAIAIDERRHAFQRVPWGKPGVWFRRRHTWFKQVWFAGNHSDVGGSYPENESRLSDIALEWMTKEAEITGLQVDRTFLRPSPDALGEQHDEARSSVFRFARKLDREPNSDAPLHPTVLDRLRAKAVLQVDRYMSYSPSALRGHKAASRFFVQGTQAKPPAKRMSQFQEQDWASKAADGEATKGVAKLRR